MIKQIPAIFFSVALLTASFTNAEESAKFREINRGHLPKLAHRAIRLADSKISEVGPEQYEWEWTGAVLMIGLSELYDFTGDRRYIDYIKKWIDFHIERGYTLSKSDQIVPAYLLVKLYKYTGDQRYLDHAMRVGKYITDEAIRTREGGLVHFGPVGGKSMWIDSLFMLSPFLVELAEVTGDPQYIDEAVNQTLIMYSHLQDPRTGLCKHFWNETKNKTNTDHWLRGNSWALAATAILIKSLPKDYDPQKRDRLVEHFRKHANGLASRQDASGMWHTVIDKPKTYIESSGTALVAFGLIKGVEAGAIDESYMSNVRRALWALMNYVTIHPDGFCTINDVSLGTNPGNAAYYNQVTRAENVPYGVGGYLLAAISYGKHAGYSFDKTAMIVEDGWEHLRWGRVAPAKKIMFEAVESAPNSSAPKFGAGFVIFAETLTKFVEDFTDMAVSSRGMTPNGLQKKIIEEYVPAFDKVSALFDDVEKDKNFTQVTERSIFLGGTSFGYMQLDLAEVHLFHAISKFTQSLFYFICSYNIDGPPLSIAKRKFGDIVRDPAYPNFLTLNDDSKELLPNSRASLDEALTQISMMKTQLDLRKVDYYGALVTNDILRLKGALYIPGIIAPQPFAALVSKNKLVQAVVKYAGRNIPEKLPKWIENARASLNDGKIVPLTKHINLNLSALYNNPKNLREFFPKRNTDGSLIFPDPTFGGLLPGMTNETLNRMAKFTSK